MSGTGFFGDIAPIRYEGPQAAIPLAFRHYDRDRWCSASDGGPSAPASATGTFRLGRAPTCSARRRSSVPGSPTTMAAARLKADVAFEMFATARRAVLHLP